MSIVIILCTGLLAFLVIFGISKNIFTSKNSKEITDTSSQTLPLIIQAHERLTLFLERIKPENLFTRFELEGLTAKELQILSSREVKQELNHNVAQQIYVSSNTWEILNSAVITLTAEINAIDNNGKSGRDLALEVLKNENSLARQLIQNALNNLKEDIQKKF